MNLYSRARKHINMKRVKEIREEKIRKKLIERQLEIAAELREIEREESKPVDWRRDINEQMTTADMGMINYEAEGDVNLETVSNSVSSVGSNPGGSGSNGNYTFGPVADETRGSSLSLSGTINATKYDTLKFNFQSGTIDKFYIVTPGGQYNLSTSSGTKVVRFNQADRNRKQIVISFYVERGSDGDLPVGNNSITNLSYQRRTPINVLVPLDDPEANAFVRGGLGGSEERKAKLKDMLDAGNELMVKMGMNPSQTSPGDIELARIYDRPGDSPGQIQWPRNYFPGKKAPPGPGARPSGKPIGPELPKAKKKSTTMVAHHEPQGEVINENDWAPIAGGGPTNSASQTFEYGGEGGAQFTANGLGGQDVYPQTIDFLGDQIPTPSYSDVALQGYTKPLSKEVMKRVEEFRKNQDENLKKIKDTLKNLGTSWEEMRANNWALVKPDGTSILLEPITPGNKQLNWIDNSKITVGKQHPDAEEKPYKVVNPDGSVTIENSKIESVKEFRVDGGLNKQLDSSEEFTKKINADEFMKGRVTDTTKPQKGFLDAVADAFGAGTAKNVFDYHMDWNKTQDPSPQDLTHLVTADDMKLLQDLVDKHSSNATDELIELGIDSELQHTIGLSQGLRNSLGVIDRPRGDGVKIVGKNIVIRKAYDFEGGFVGGATGLSAIPASIYGMTQGAFSKTGAMDMIVRVPLRRKKKVNESTWGKLKKRRRG